MSEFSIEVSGPAPAINAAYKVNYGDNGKRSFYKDSKVSTWQDTVAWLIRGAKPKNWAATRRVMIVIEWYNPRKRDCDSGVKFALDAVATGLGIDDGCFLLSVPVNETDKANPRTKITVMTLEGT